MDKSNQAGKVVTSKVKKSEEELEQMREELNSQSAEEAEDSPSKTEGEEQTPESESATDEEAPAEETDTEQTQDDGPESEDTETKPDDQQQDSAPKKPSRKAEKRFRSLAERAKKAEDQARRATELLQQYVYGSKPPQAQAEGEDGEYLSIDDVIRNVQEATRQTIHEEREAEINEQRWSTWREDAEYLEKTYALFDPNHKEYDDDLVSDILNEFKGRYREDKDLRLKDLAEKRIKQAEKLAEKLKSQAAQLIRKQVSEQAIGGGDTPAPSKSSMNDRIARVRTPQDLEELKHEIGYVEH